MGSTSIYPDRKKKPEHRGAYRVYAARSQETWGEGVYFLYAGFKAGRSQDLVYAEEVRTVRVPVC
jgi:hypothetical protein